MDKNTIKTRKEISKVYRGLTIIQNTSTSSMLREQRIENLGPYKVVFKILKPSTLPSSND